MLGNRGAVAAGSVVVPPTIACRRACKSPSRSPRAAAATRSFGRLLKECCVKRGKFDRARSGGDKVKALRSGVEQKPVAAQVRKRRPALGNPLVVNPSSVIGSFESLQKIIDVIPSPVFVKDREH